MDIAQPHSGAAAPIPKHIAIIMDGNRRWAANRMLPKAAGHAAGAKRVKELVRACASQGVECLTLFAFSTENWRRPQDEVQALMRLLTLYLGKEVSELHAEGVRLRIIGDTSALSKPLSRLIDHAHQLTAANTGLTLNVAVNYGGRWDILQAVRQWQADHPGQSAEQLDEATLDSYLCTGGQPAPDLLIRTGGEIRISNFLLWQLAYTEMFFTDALFPAFTAVQLQEAINWYAGRERRYGASTGAQGAIDSAPDRVYEDNGNLIHSKPLQHPLTAEMQGTAGAAGAESDLQGQVA